MAGDLGVVVSGDRNVSIKFDEFPQKLHRQLLARIVALTNALAARVRGAVPVLTGKLQGEIGSRIYDKEDRIVGVVEVTGDYAKAGALEYGAQGTSQVGSHSLQLDHVFYTKLNGPIAVMVAAHSRQMNLVATRFMRGSEADMRVEITAGLKEAVTETVTDTNS